MSKKLVISEQEKNNIKSMYGLNEQDNDMSFINALLKKAMELSKNNNSSTETSTDSEDESGDENTSDVDVTNTGEIDLSNGNFDSTQKENIKLLIDAMEEEGIKDPVTQIGILSVISKESNFKPKGEVSYASTSNSRIRSIFGKRVSKYSDSELDSIKRDPKKFFDLVYGGRFGNAPDEGYKYRGRGFNQLTFKGNYKKYGNLIGVDLVGNPDLANDPKVAAKIALSFLTKGKNSFPKFDSKEDAATYFADINAGGSGASLHRNKAIAATEKFDVKNLA
jgi:predicted chitinase